MKSISEITQLYMTSVALFENGNYQGLLENPRMQ